MSNEMEDIRTNVTERVYYIKTDEGSGSCFLLDLNESEYIVTAKHVVPNTIKGSRISLFLDGDWKEFEVVFILNHHKEDVSILGINNIFNCNTEVLYSLDMVRYGQDVAFFGFPYGMLDRKYSVVNSTRHPLAMVKKGSISGIIEKDGERIIVVDGYNNPGFSGGPLAFYNQVVKKWSICGIVSSYRYESLPVFNEDDINMGYCNTNTGIMFAVPIEYALDLIKMNFVEL